METTYTDTVVEIFKQVLNSCNINDVTYNEELMTFFGDELEYQIRDCSDGSFKSILVRFSEDSTHTYREFYEIDYNSIYDLIYDALSDDTAEWLANVIRKKVNND